MKNEEEARAKRVLYYTHIYIRVFGCVACANAQCKQALELRNENEKNYRLR
jgi:hypothetical protein